MHYICCVNWISPTSLLQYFHIKYDDIALFFSAKQLDYTGDYSFLMIDKYTEIIGDNLSILEKIFKDKNDIHNNNHKKNSYNTEHSAVEHSATEYSAEINFLLNKVKYFWAGYLAYDLKNEIEKSLINTQKTLYNYPQIKLNLYKHIIVFNHNLQKLFCFSYDNEGFNREILPIIQNINSYKLNIIKTNISKTIKDRKIEEIHSFIDDKQYLNQVHKIQEHIKNGDIYQANLTRKYYGKLKKNIDICHIFRDLCQISPSPYAAFIKNGDNYIISSSPERFINLTKDGEIDTRPIKGTAPRLKFGSKLDFSTQARDDFQNNAKEKAENLMIVDLMRNDLSKISKKHSVKVEKLFKITEHNNIYHMSSIIKSQFDQDKYNILDLIKASFPPGSMTGAPKVKAMDICSKIEEYKRMIYSGIILYLGADGSMDSSVVIRTIIVNGDNFEFQLGGAITYDSKAEKELEEIFHKGYAICKTLGIDNLRGIGTNQ